MLSYCDAPRVVTDAARSAARALAAAHGLPATAAVVLHAGSTIVVHLETVFGLRFRAQTSADRRQPPTEHRGAPCRSPCRVPRAARSAGGLCRVGGRERRLRGVVIGEQERCDPVAGVLAHHPPTLHDLVVQGRHEPPHESEILGRRQAPGQRGRAFEIGEQHRAGPSCRAHDLQQALQRPVVCGGQERERRAGDGGDDDERGPGEHPAVSSTSATRRRSSSRSATRRRTWSTPNGTAPTRRP